MSSLDTESLIVEVRRWPLLWDLSHSNYKNKEEKQKAWLEIAKKLFKNFDSFTRDDKEKTMKSILQRWKSARDEYVRHRASILSKKSDSSAKSKRKYVYANLMDFLEPVTNLRFLRESWQSISNTSNVSTRASSGEDSSTTQEPATLPFKKKKEDLNETSTFETEILKMCKTNMDLSLDEDLAFFHSVLPTVRKFDLQTKLYFRSQILQLLVQCTTNQTSPQPCSTPVPSSSRTPAVSSSISEESVPCPMVPDPGRAALSPLSQTSYTSIKYEENDST